MSMNFIALLHYRNFYPYVEQTMHLLENNQPIPELRAVTALREELGWPTVPLQQSCWTDREGYSISAQPTLPSSNALLRTPDHFTIAVSQDTLRVYNGLHWSSFLDDLRWQDTLLQATAVLCEMFAAEDCIITNDYNRATNIFFENATFAEALQIAEPDEGEVSQISDLDQAKEEDSDLAFKLIEGTDEQEGMIWPRNKPLPDGWLRPTVWDSKGYWRFRWKEYVPRH
jgi:hypothetical protein